jgi:hypothetical protein
LGERETGKAGYNTAREQQEIRRDYNREKKILSDVAPLLASSGRSDSVELLLTAEAASCSSLTTARTDQRTRWIPERLWIHEWVSSLSTSRCSPVLFACDPSDDVEPLAFGPGGKTLLDLSFGRNTSGIPRLFPSERRRS